ncbi:MAG: Asp23/Gls24 family envelope stress response protein [Anaerovoracaceae bacterium]
MFTKETELGNISMTKNVIGRIVLEVVGEFGGKVIVSNHKGGPLSFVSKIGGTEETNNMEVIFNDGDKGIDLRVYIVIRFGTSITLVTNTLVDKLHKSIKMMTGVEPNSVAVIVTGIISKNIAKRHIEVTR